MTDSSGSSDDRMRPDLSRTRTATLAAREGSEIEVQLPMHGQPGIVESLDAPALVGHSARSPLPALRLDWAVCDDKAKGPFFSGITDIPLLTPSTGLGCVSFMLPSGSPRRHGCCAAADPKGAKGLRKRTATFCCDVCWTCRGQHALSEVAFMQAIRRVWVLDHLRRDPSGRTLARDLVAAIADFARGCTLAEVPGGSNIRKHIELGTWKNAYVEVPTARRGKLCHEWAISVDLSESIYGARTTNKVLARRSPTDGDVAGFVLVHGSGDLTVGNPLNWISYLSAWVEVARALPSVLFVMPTRAWKFSELRISLEKATLRAPNLVIRPGALHVDEAPPVVMGLASGTSMVQARPAAGDQGFESDRRGRRPVVCPAMRLRSNPGTRKTKDLGLWLRKGSCAKANCRACWLLPAAPIGFPFRIPAMTGPTQGSVADFVARWRKKTNNTLPDEFSTWFENATGSFFSTEASAGQMRELWLPPGASVTALALMEGMSLAP